MGREVRELAGMPSTNALLAKALAGALRKRGRAVGSLPDRSFLLLEHEQDLAALAAYDRVTGFGVADSVSATWLHVQTFPLQAALMAEDDFPFSLAGLVHTHNEMTLMRPVGVGERLRLGVRASGPRPHAKGALFDLVSEVHVGDEPVWRGVSTYLASGAKLDGEPALAERLAAPQAAPSQRWRLGPDLGRRYAAVSGDANPIHLHPLTARLFGFPRPIAHGMWTHARALAAFGGSLPEAYSVRVQFAKPILLPGSVWFATDADGHARRFAVLNKESKPHLVGELLPVAP